MAFCGRGGDVVFGGLKRRVLERGLSGEIWVTATSCLGFCHQDGSTVAIYDGGERSLSGASFWQGVVLEDVDALWEEIMRRCDAKKKKR